MSAGHPHAGRARKKAGGAFVVMVPEGCTDDAVRKLEIEAENFHDRFLLAANQVLQPSARMAGMWVKSKPDV